MFIHLFSCKSHAFGIDRRPICSGVPFGPSRFIARRGTPRQIVSDNVKQFKTASTILNKVWSEALTSSEVRDYAIKVSNGDL